MLSRLSTVPLLFISVARMIGIISSRGRETFGPLYICHVNRFTDEIAIEIVFDLQNHIWLDVAFYRYKSFSFCSVSDDQIIPFLILSYFPAHSIELIAALIVVSATVTRRSSVESCPDWWHSCGSALRQHVPVKRFIMPVARCGTVESIYLAPQLGFQNICNPELAADDHSAEILIMDGVTKRSQ